LEIIRRIEKELLFVFLKVNAEFYIIMDAIALCLKISGLSILDGKFTAFVNKLIVFLSEQDKGPTAKAATPLNSYMVYTKYYLSRKYKPAKCSIRSQL
jgi:hypothetical protein